MQPAASFLEGLYAFLSRPTSYPHRPERVILKQTHASVVAIAPPYVFKVKKPVNFGFLDFTSLARRKAACERELWLNRRLCPEMYLGVVPIAATNQGLAFSTAGPVVEYALQMHQLADGYCPAGVKVR
jgi:aminoglycoside phosphotransferase family enzyme